MSVDAVQIGVAERTWPTVAGPATTASWYPSRPGLPAAPYCGLYPAAAAREATPMPGVFPLVVLLSGTGGNRYTHSYLAEDLARRGFWVIAPETPGPAQWTDRRREARTRPALVRAVVSAALDSDLAAAIDPRRIIVVGFSSGGYVGLVLAGAQPAAQRGGAAGEVPGPPERPVPGPALPLRLAALVLLDPALASAFTPAMLASITLPTALFTSGLEDADLLGRTDDYAAHLGNLRLSHRFAEAGHYVYCNLCPPLLTKIAPRVCVDRWVERAAVHRELTRLIGGFLAPWRVGVEGAWAPSVAC